MVDIDAFIQSMKNGSGKFESTDKRDTIKFLGIEITHIDEKRFKLPQPFLIGRIISLLNIDTNDYGMDTNTKYTPVVIHYYTRTYLENDAERHRTTERHL